MYDWEKEQYRYIGSFDDFILAVSRRIQCIQHKKPALLSSYHLNFEKVSLNPADMYSIVNEKYIFNANGSISCIHIKNRMLYNRTKTYVDGMGRFIDPRNYFKEAVQRYILENNKVQKYHNWNWQKYRNRNRHLHTRYGHSKNTFKGKMPKGLHALKKYETAYYSDEEYKEYSFKKNVYDHNNPIPEWWDDTHRRVEGNWKSQNKTRKQYDIHTNKKDYYEKNFNSIRKGKKDYYEYTFDDADFLLEEDFVSQLPIPKGN